MRLHSASCWLDQCFTFYEKRTLLSKELPLYPYKPSIFFLTASPILFNFTKYNNGFALTNVLNLGGKNEKGKGTKKLWFYFLQQYLRINGLKEGGNYNKQQTLTYLKTHFVLKEKG